MIDEVKRLYGLGFAIHWLRPKSKAPVESGWTTGPRKSLKELIKTKPPKCNVGVRLGKASMLTDGCSLGVIDCDVKSSDPKHTKEMLAALDDLWVDGPTVFSGRGNGARHVYVKSKKPLAPRRVTQSKDKVRVMMPSVAPSKNELTKLKTKDIEAGWRLRAAWEISIMGEGQQVVLPPSIHPDTGKEYGWFATLQNVDQIPLFSDIGANKVVEQDTPDDAAPLELEPVDLDLSRLTPRMISLIRDGDNSCGDLSTDLFHACREMHACGFTPNEIATVCTDPNHFITQAARKRRNGRRSQMDWVAKYTVKKIENSLSAKIAFKEAADIDDSELREHEVDDSWRNSLKKTQKGDIKAGFTNIKKILS